MSSTGETVQCVLMGWQAYAPTLVDLCLQPAAMGTHTSARAHTYNCTHANHTQFIVSVLTRIGISCKWPQRSCATAIRVFFCTCAGDDARQHGAWRQSRMQKAHMRLISAVTHTQSMQHTFTHPYPPPNALKNANARTNTHKLGCTHVCRPRKRSRRLRGGCSRRRRSGSAS